MLIRIWLVGILVQAVFCLSPDRVGAQQSDAGLASANVVDPVSSAEIYRRDCLVCHGANGDGKTDILRDRELNLPDWTDRSTLIGLADQQLFNVIRFGRGKMPAESVGRADDADVRGLIRYIRSMGKKKVAATPADTTSAGK